MPEFRVRQALTSFCKRLRDVLSVDNRGVRGYVFCGCFSFIKPAYTDPLFKNSVLYYFSYSFLVTRRHPKGA
jgi:hypothetical protein